jgi:molecular chaperone HtpG
LCFNLQNPVIQKLIRLSDETQLTLYIKILYVQALLLGHHPLQQEDLNILSDGLTSLIDFGIQD